MINAGTSKTDGAMSGRQCCSITFTAIYKVIYTICNFCKSIYMSLTVKDRALNNSRPTTSPKRTFYQCVDIYYNVNYCSSRLVLHKLQAPV